MFFSKCARILLSLSLLVADQDGICLETLLRPNPFNGSMIERKAAATTIRWHGMSEGPECVAFSCHTSTDYVLEGAESSARSDSWAGN